MKTVKLTAKEIADDVQQTYDNIPCSYRQILEDRITEYTKQESAELLKALIEIAKGEGRYDIDKLKHAGNTIDDMKLIAHTAIKKTTK